MRHMCADGDDTFDGSHTHLPFDRSNTPSSLHHRLCFQHFQRSCMVMALQVTSPPSVEPSTDRPPLAEATAPLSASTSRLVALTPTTLPEATASRAPCCQPRPWLASPGVALTPPTLPEATLPLGRGQEHGLPGRPWPQPRATPCLQAMTAQPGNCPVCTLHAPCCPVNDPGARLLYTATWRMTHACTQSTLPTGA